ncbi:MAG: SDR family oxidoreductase [Burkholderiales bacterium]
MDSQRLKGKRAIVTGAGSGIGRASAIRFASEGAQVVVVGRRQEKIDETVALIGQGGGSAMAIAADAAIEANVKTIIARCIEVFGGLEVFFANAAYTEPAPAYLFDQTVELWTETMRVNVISCFLAAKHAGLHMREHGGGSIIFTSSVASLRGNGGDSCYSASKAAVNSLARGAACEMAGTNVRVNAVLPGLIETDGTKDMIDAARARGVEHKLGRVNPLKRIGQANEIAAMAAFLASDDSSYVNGQCYAVDGGVSASHPGKF